MLKQLLGAGYAEFERLCSVEKTSYVLGSTTLTLDGEGVHCNFMGSMKNYTVMTHIQVNFSVSPWLEIGVLLMRLRVGLVSRVSLVRTCKKFSRKHRTIFNRYGVSVRQHIDEGICRPLCIIRKLSKNITMNRCRHMSTLPRCT